MLRADDALRAQIYATVFHAAAAADILICAFDAVMLTRAVSLIVHARCYAAGYMIRFFAAWLPLMLPLLLPFRADATPALSLASDAMTCLFADAADAARCCRCLMLLLPPFAMLPIRHAAAMPLFAIVYDVDTCRAALCRYLPLFLVIFRLLMLPRLRAATPCDEDISYAMFAVAYMIDGTASGSDAYCSRRRDALKKRAHAPRAAVRNR